MAFSHLRRKACSKRDRAPSSGPREGDDHVRCQSVRIIHREQVFIGDGFAVFRKALELSLDDVGALSQHLSVAVFFKGTNREKPFPGLFVQEAAKVHVQVVGCQIRERHVNPKFISHSKYTTCEHSGQITCLGIGWHQTISKHVTQSMKVVWNGVNVGKGLGDGRELFTGDFNPSLVQFRKEKVEQFLSVNPCLDVHDSIQSGHFTQELIQIQRWPLLGNRVKTGELFQPIHRFRIDGFVNRGRSCCSPTKPFQSVAGVNDLKRHGSITVALQFNITVGMLLHVHEDERRQFKAANDDLDGRPSVATTTPWIFHVGDFFGGNTKSLRQHSVTMLNTGFHPIQFEPFIWAIKHVMCHHFKRGKMAP